VFHTWVRICLLSWVCNAVFWHTNACVTALKASGTEQWPHSIACVAFFMHLNSCGKWRCLPYVSSLISVQKLQRVWLINLARRRSNASKYYNERPNMFCLQVKKLILSYSHSRPRRRNNCDIQWRILGTPGERHGRSCSCESSELKQQQTFCILLFVRSAAEKDRR